MSGNQLAVMRSWFLDFGWRDYHPSITVQNKHYLTSSATKVYANFVDENASIKPLASGLSKI